MWTLQSRLLPSLPGGRTALIEPELPPAFQLVPVDAEADAFERARRAAPRGLEDGTVYWCRQVDRLRLALVLEPEARRRRPLDAVYLTMLALGEALAGTVPVSFVWPGGVLADGRRLGSVRAALAPVAAGVTPPWLVIGVDLDILALDGAITVAAVAEGLCERFLAWRQRWLKEGIAPVRAAWNERCLGLGQEIAVERDGLRCQGAIGGLDAEGRFIIGDSRLALEDALGELG